LGIGLVVFIIVMLMDQSDARPIFYPTVHWFGDV